MQKKYKSRIEKKIEANKQNKFKNTKIKEEVEQIDIRLNKFIANAGLCSRREADKHIVAGNVTVNNKTVKELGTKVKSSDIVKVKGKKMSAEKKQYILLNKPKDFITTLSDPYAKKKVIDLIKNACEERVYPVGRLDRNTTGLLLFTNDGDITGKLTHPKYNKKKTYHVSLDKVLTKRDLSAIIEGVELDDGMAKPDAVSYVEGMDKSNIGVEIHSGKNRIIRRIFEHFDYKVIRLDRVYFAGLTKKSLPRGKWRFLSKNEIGILKSGRYE